MWRFGRQAAAALGRQAPAGLYARPNQFPVSDFAPRQVVRRFREFCAEAAPERPRPRPKAQQAPAVTPLKVGSFVLVGTGVAYAASEDVQKQLDPYVNMISEFFEDFNDSSLEFFNNIGNKFVAPHKEPWLLDLATMKYPENIPTIVLDLDKVIIHLEHDSRKGWQVIKRPFADQFLKEISHYYEVVLFTDEVFPVGLEIAGKMNLPVTAVLHRDFCRKKRQHYIKDISKLGRRMDRVLMVDHDAEAFQLQPENGIHIREYNGDPNDSELADLLEFLKAAASTQGDIRQFVEKFGGGDYDVGRRYLIYKQEQDSKVANRRSFGRAFASKTEFPGGRGGGGMGPPGSFGSNFPR
eukprot:TRINITY_DN79242_c0_g1_i1.p1 TRINITY_DN79242_c0_g1~~TRINITY_DN79242_c0_g1_i1.p1  ORF type:complete len:353 (+),score=77.02 TRINITY_DN79242_c0_g1_i1:97-1155(+)